MKRDLELGKSNARQGVVVEAINQWLRRKGQNQATLAQQAHVGTVLISEMIQGSLTRKSVSEFSSRRQVGLAQSLTRLSLFFQKQRGIRAFSPMEAIQEYGIPANSTVTEAIERATRTAERTNLEDLPTRSTPITVGVLSYGPFSEQQGTGFLTTYLGALIRIINPSASVKSEVYYNFREAIADLTQAKPRVEVLVGLFRTLSREALGISFLTIPGLRVHLGGLIHRKWAKDHLNWAKLVRQDFRPDEAPVAVVIEDEAGFLWATGPGDGLHLGNPETEEERSYVIRPEEDSSAFERTSRKTTRPDVAVLASVRYAYSCYELRELKVPVLFIADQFTVTEVRNWLGAERFVQFLKEDRAYDDSFGNWFSSNRDKICEEIPDGDIAPNFQLAIAVPERHQKWCDWLSRAQGGEFFTNYATYTASLYAQLLIHLQKKGQLSSLNVEVWSSLTESERESFLRLLSRHVSELLREKFGEDCAIRERYSAIRSRIPGLPEVEFQSQSNGGLP